ncbi:Spermidine/putrescine-binding periplasmic protein (modular protein) [Candidatus Desulfosporosinus infrequens]|uniref:Spermidine/putrescine-binding periplasmic protein (Modular protein) n=1 Tax=Candidatus Desulfosporosinus infrequens TaxID=2043169 RepID=A0A2U3KK94_9FIRM|nr:Spermidine/putrescine-binding periplasmic protein (modular protein) [Candidatus Desulfosporosinus infrequens]
MRKKYFSKLVSYMKNVYHVDRGLNKLSDGRVNPTYSTGQVILPVLFGFLLRIKSFNELNFMIKNNEFSKLLPRGTKPAQVDAIRDTLKVIDINGLNQKNQHIVKKSVENKVFENGTIDGYTVIAIDGTKFFGSNKKSCPECLKNTKGEKTHCFHSGAVMSTVGIGPKLVIGFEMYKPGQDSASKDEGELNVAKRLISSVVKGHNKFIDVVVYDALACNSIWINHCKNLVIDVVVRAKNNNNNSLRLAKRKTNKSEAVEVWEDEKGFEKVEVYESTFTMDNVEQPLRFVKFAIKHKDKKRTQIMIVTTCLDMALKTLYKIIRARWDIENSIFNNLKTECGLEHCFVHGGKAVEAVLYLIFIASNILHLFLFRRLRKQFTTQREMVRLLLKGLYLLKYKAELVFSSA